MKHNNLPHAIIIELFDNYYSYQTKIPINKLVKSFGKEATEYVRCNMIKSVLDTLEEKNYIVWTVTRLDPKGIYLWHEDYKKEFATDGKNGFLGLNNDDTQISAVLQPQGVDYALEIIRGRAQYRNNNIAVVIATLAFLVAASSLITAISQYKLQQSLLTDQKEPLRRLEMTVQNLQTDLKNLIQERKDDSARYFLNSSSIIIKP